MAVGILKTLKMKWFIERVEGKEIIIIVFL